jgi:uncharacterized protein
MSQPQWGYSSPGWSPQPARSPRPGWAPQPGGFAPRPQAAVVPQSVRRRNPLALVLLGLIGVTLIALIGLAVAGLTAKPAQVQYANDNYQVPDADLHPPAIPAPTSLDQAKQWTTDNALYKQTTPAPVRCKLDPIDVTTAGDAALKSHFEALMACLVRVWQPPLTAAGFQIYRPTVTIYGTDISTACGSGDESHNAFYCGADQQVYWSNTLGPDLPPPSVNKYPGDEVLAHEFGHAVQGRTGLLLGEQLQSQQATSKSDALLFSRRTEMQADCFAGVFLRSVSLSLGLTQSDVALIQDTFASFGDDRRNPDAAEGNHGKSATRRYWVTTGLGEGNNGKCNTFSASPDLLH